MQIILSGAVANFSGLTNQQFLEYLQEKDNTIEYYRLQPKTGSVYNAALDWKAIGNVSAVLGIASFLWQAYTQLIVPNKEPTSNSGIIIRIENAGSHNQFWIGNDTTSKEEIIEKLKRALKEVDTTKNQKQIDAIKNSGLWIQVK